MSKADIFLWDWRITGTAEGAAIHPACSPYAPHEVTLSGGAGDTTYELEPVDQMVAEFDSFADCLLSGRAANPDGGHSLQNMWILQAIDQVTETGERIELLLLYSVASCPARGKDQSGRYSGERSRTTEPEGTEQN